MSPHPSDGTLPLHVTHRNVAPGVWLPRTAPSVAVRPDEFIGAREASRSLGKVLERLRSGDVDKFVIVNRNEPQAVLLTLERYAALSATQEKAASS